MNTHRYNSIQEFKDAFKMTESEKNALALKLEQYVDAHPATVTSPRPGLSGWTLFFRRQEYMYAAVIVLVFAIGGGSTLFAAKGALPGDFLYPVKVSVGESLRGTMVLSRQAQVAWEQELTGRRLSELAMLDGASDSHVAAEVANVALMSLKEVKDIPENVVSKLIPLATSALIGQAQALSPLDEARTKLVDAQRELEIAQEEQDANPTRDGSAELISLERKVQKAALAVSTLIQVEKKREMLDAAFEAKKAKHE